MCFSRCVCNCLITRHHIKIQYTAYIPIELYIVTDRWNHQRDTFTLSTSHTHYTKPATPTMISMFCFYVFILCLVGLTPYPHLECRGPRKSENIPLLTLRACVAYKRVKTYLSYLAQGCTD